MKYFPKELDQDTTRIRGLICGAETVVQILQEEGTSLPNYLRKATPTNKNADP